jgi:hypothetical protein
VWNPPPLPFAPPLMWAPCHMGAGESRPATAGERGRGPSPASGAKPLPAVVGGARRPVSGFWSARFVAALQSH